MRTLLSATAAAALVAGVTFCVTASAAEDQERVARRDRAERDRAGQLDSKTSGTNVRASQMIGHNIQNPRGENVGEINDIVIDARTGKIRYVAVTYGGFLGVGDKLFAVPYEAFECKPNPEDRDETVVVLDVTPEQLEGAKGFDQDNWPNFANKGFTDELDKRYRVDRTRRDRRTKVDVDVRGDRIDAEVERDRDEN